MLLSYPLMSAIQLVSARIGRVTGSGLAVNMGAIWPKWLVTGLVCLLFVANCINIGANLAAMGASVELATGMPSLPITIFFALLSLGLQMFIPYERYANILKWLTLVLFAYIAVLCVVKIDWMATLKGFVWPTFALNNDSFTVVVAILCTTISPYLFVWQSSQEVEEIDRKEEAKPLEEAPPQAPKELNRIELDTLAGMAVSTIVAVAIMICAAATLHANGKTDINSAADVAEALKPIAGNLPLSSSASASLGRGCCRSRFWLALRHMPSPKRRTGTRVSTTNRGKPWASTALSWRRPCSDSASNLCRSIRSRRCSGSPSSTDLSPCQS